MPAPAYDRTSQVRDTVVRLTRVRGELTDEQFDRLVAAVLQMQTRFQEIDNAQHRTPKPMERSQTRGSP